MRVTVAVALWATQGACSFGERWRLARCFWRPAKTSRERVSCEVRDTAGGAPALPPEFANRLTGSEYFQWVRRSG
jgi:hypothetical protein